MLSRLYMLFCKFHMTGSLVTMSNILDLSSMTYIKPLAAGRWQENANGQSSNDKGGKDSRRLRDMW